VCQCQCMWASSFSSPARVLKQRVQKFKNFPVVGIKENQNIDTFDEHIVNEEPNIEHPRDARQVENYSAGFSDFVDDQFVEEAVYLTPEDREARSIDPVEGLVKTLEEDPAEFLFDEVNKDDQIRAERDGAHGHHGSNHHRGGRAQQRVPVPVAVEYDDDYDYDYQEPARQPQQQRRGKQTGAVGVALGVLSSPPSSDGNYNFNFANDDGSSRQEVGAPDAIRGSYSFITPEGEQVQVQYHADETGFHATGSHVPQAPPMPPHVQRLLDHLAKVNGLGRL